MLHLTREDAIAAVEKYSFDFSLAMVDIQMPKKTGIEVLAAIARTAPETECRNDDGFLARSQLAVEAMQRERRIV